MAEKVSKQIVPVNVGKLLENQLSRWKGGGHHSRGIAEYISNSDDSYRRLKKFSDQEIIVEIHARGGKKIEKLIVKDYAEGMSYDELENKFFQYFESFSGRETGEKVTGRFGTGGKAYAIMNFRHCWISSVQNGRECKAWFQWDYKNKEIIKGYDGQGYKNKSSSQRNGTTIVLESSIKVNQPVEDFIVHLEKSARIRHILKSQNVTFKIIKGRNISHTQLKYFEPDSHLAKKIWKYPLPNTLKNNEHSHDNNLVLRYFEKPLGDNAFIDLMDGISSVADMTISDYDNRPLSKYINGSLVITQLLNSDAVKENRRGLEEGDDLTAEINGFVKEKVSVVINEVEELQKQLDKERRIKAANEKLNELSKFLSKQDLRFKLELKELKKRFTKTTDPNISKETDNNSSDNQDIFRPPTQDDPSSELVKGIWVRKIEEEGGGTTPNDGISEFIPDENGLDSAVRVGNRKRIASKEVRTKKGLQVQYSNDPKNPESPIMNEFMEPVSDRDMVSKGIIWINAVHPIIEKFETTKSNDIVRDENIANYVLMMVSQYYAQKEAELHPEDERDDLLILFRKHFFKLQMDLRLDSENTYYTND